MLYKGAILHAWQKKQTVALHRAFFDTLPDLPTVSREESDVAWFVYDLQFIEEQNLYQLVPYSTVYTRFGPALEKITTPEAGPLKEFLNSLQAKLDAKLENNCPPDAPTLTDIIQNNSMAYQLSFFPQDDKIINVASVPLRSPFRYPGGKTWLVPRIRRWLAHLPEKPRYFVEPFTGGGIIGLTVAFEDMAEHITLVELDAQVASVWKTILSEDGDWLAQRILEFEFSAESVEAELNKTNLSTRELAFQTILRNRVNRGGILAPGAGKVKYGENGKGLASRWYPETLSKRIRAINRIRDKFTFIEGDGIQVIKDNLTRTDAVFFIDPPYTAGGKKAGSRLYTHSELNHEELFSLCSQLTGDFLMTYSNDRDVRALAQEYHLAAKAIAMKNTHHARMTELLIGRDLSWDD